MAELWTYLYSVVLEGAAIGIVFWIICYITVESSSLWGAIRAAIIAELLGNIPYLWGLDATSGPGMICGLAAAVLFVYLIQRVGELTAMRAAYATAMTYFALVAIVACSPT